jgi:hypothetical protein
MNEPTYRPILLAKDAEHRRMADIAKDLAAIRQYLDAAPDGRGYEEFSRRIRCAYAAA